MYKTLKALCVINLQFEELKLIQIRVLFFFFQVDLTQRTIFQTIFPLFSVRR